MTTRRRQGVSAQQSALVERLLLAIQDSPGDPVSLLGLITSLEHREAARVAAEQWAPFANVVRMAVRIVRRIERTPGAGRWGKCDQVRALRLFCRTSARRQLDELLQKLTPIVVRHTARLEGLARSATGRKHVLPRAVFLKKEHPEWSDAQIARAIGCEQSALSKSAEWRRIKAQVERVLRIDSAGRFADGRGRRVDDEDPEGDPSTGPGG